MPAKTNNNGAAMINMGFITVSLIGLWIAVGFWKRKGSGIETQPRHDAEAELYTTVAFAWPGFLSPLARH
jgi:hypothetical protein